MWVLGAQVAAPDAALPRCAALRAGAAVATAPLEMHPPDTADLRDVLELGLAPDGPRPDVLVTSDPVVIAFARQRGAYHTVPLPWQRSYVLATARGRVIAAFSSSEERDALARDALGAAARGAVTPFPGRDDPACFAAPIVARGNPARAIAYSTGDETARALAERLVVQTGMERVVALSSDSLGPALAAGRAIAAVVAVARDPRRPCATRGDEPVPAGAVPLVDVHEHAIVRRGSGAAFVVAPDATLHFVRGARR